MSEPVLVDGTDPTPTTCAGGCPRHAAMKPLLAAIAWLAAAVGSLFVAMIPFDDGESFCGVWGCYPPFPALVAMHLCWCVAFGAVVHAIKHWRAGFLRPAGFVLILAAVATAATVVGNDLTLWLDQVSDRDRGFWPRRVAYTLATQTDLPFVPALAAGIACLMLASHSKPGVRRCTSN